MASDLLVQEKYNVTQKSALFQRLRFLMEKIGNCQGRPLSAQAISDLMDDVYFNYSYWTEKKCPLWVDVYKRGALDAHTLRKLMNCVLDYTLRTAVQNKTVRSVHVFLQILETDPPDFLAGCLGE